MGDSIILISSDSSPDNSNSPPIQRSYFGEGVYNSNFLRLGSDEGNLEGEQSQTKYPTSEHGEVSKQISTFIQECNRNVHDLSCSDSNEENNDRYSPKLIANSTFNDQATWARPRNCGLSDKDDLDLDLSFESRIDPMQGVKLGLDLSGSSPNKNSSNDLQATLVRPRICDLSVEDDLDQDLSFESRIDPMQGVKLGLDFSGGSPKKNVPVSSPEKNCKRFPDLETYSSDLLISDVGLNPDQLHDKNITKKATVEEKRHAAKIMKESKQVERAKKLAEQAQVKASKQALANARKLIKPEECIKYLSVKLDHKLFEQEFCGNLYNELEAAGVTYTVQSQTIPLTVTWTRQVPSPTPEGNMKTQHEHHSLIIIPCDQLVQLIQSRGLCDYVQGVRAVAPQDSFTLILHGTENFFKSQKKTKVKEVSKMSHDDLTEALVEVQLFANCDHRFVESCLELATTICQFSKAVAEIPYRLDKQKKEEDKLEWFGESDSRDCVRVDKNGHGLLRLWQQQLCEFNLAGLQMAEAITAIYPTPQALFQAYDSCSSQSKREMLLQDVPIRRGVGALSSVRRIGPELSKKLHTFFTTLDGEVDLSND